ncbi:MAG: hypothetical protein RIQ88_121 [Actinomycetota bacterium]
MIEEIRITDLGVISEAELSFAKGLTVLSGETGAGKTMVLTALGLLLGERSDSSSVRSGATQTNISGTFKLNQEHPSLAAAIEAGALVDDGELILARQVHSDGKSKAIAGGRAIPVGLLAELGQNLVVVHGQSDQIRLKSASAQRQALDQFAGREHLSLLAEYSIAYSNWQEAKTRLADALAGTEALAKEKQELIESLEILGSLDPKANEDQELAELAQRLTHSESLRNLVGQAHDALVSDGFDSVDALGQLGVARKALENAANYDSSLIAKADALNLLGQQLNDLAAELSSYLVDAAEGSNLSLDEIQERRSELTAAMRRFGPSLDEVIQFRAKAEQRLAFLSGESQSIEVLDQSVIETEKVARNLAEKLSKSRVAAAQELATRVTEELISLAMADSKLHVQVETLDQLNSFGSDSISFLLESYKGAEPRPVSKAASGGELSRIMLALEVILSESEEAATFIFDEVDAGVGGAAAIEVGKALAQLAKRAQVIVVTHLAQVAAFADKHLRVVKTSEAGFTSSDVRDLTGEDRVAELARMLSGLSASDSAREHAVELLQLAKS